MIDFFASSNLGASFWWALDDDMLDKVDEDEDAEGDVGMEGKEKRRRRRCGWRCFFMMRNSACCCSFVGRCSTSEGISSFSSNPPLLSSFLIEGRGEPVEVSLGLIVQEELDRATLSSSPSLLLLLVSSPCP